MLAPFAEEELRTFKGRGGKDMTFIEDETVMDRLDLGYGPGNWQIYVEAVPYIEGVVKVRMGVRDGDEWIWNEDFGYPNQKDGDQLKESVSDGIRRCGRYFGIARDLYRKRTYETPPRQSAPQRPVAQHDRPPDRPALVRTTHTDGLIGKVATSGTQDFNLRETPTGWVLPFRLKDGNKAGQIVMAHDDLAKALAPFKDSLIGQQVTIWGTYSDEESPPKADGFVVRFKVLHLERIQTPDFTLPARIEAVPEPMFPDEMEQAAIAANEWAEANA